MFLDSTHVLFPRTATKFNAVSRSPKLTSPPESPTISHAKLPPEHANIQTAALRPGQKNTPVNSN